MPRHNSMQIIDLRSDTVTRPDRAMLEAIARAPLGDDVFGDDPTVRALEERAAALTAKEAALFVPSGTMANSIAVGLHARPGDEVLLHTLGHSFNFECGGAARLWGVQTLPLAGEGGRIPLAAIEGAVRPEGDVHLPRTRLVVLEQTSNIPGGKILPLEYLRQVGDLCRRRRLRFHLDGARIFNASVESGVPVREYAACADTVMFCVSKGLGAPAGSLLAGPREEIDQARRLRKLLGGGMRQAGVLAACGLHALEHNVERLREDHRRARELARALEAFTSRGLRVEPPETNMLYLRWRGRDADRYEHLIASLREAGLLAAALFEHGVRLVFHRDIDDAAALRAREILARALDRALPGA